MLRRISFSCLASLLAVAGFTAAGVTAAGQLPASAQSYPACSVSGATGAGSPSNTVNVGAPVAGGGNSEPEIQAAINSANSAGGGKVVLQAGTYSVNSPVTVKAGVDLTGAGESSTTIQATTSVGASPVVETAGSSNVTIEALTVNQDGHAQTTRSLSQYMVDLGGGTNVLVQGIATRDPSTYSLVPHDGITHFCLRSNSVEDTNSSSNFANLDGIHTTHASYGDILDNYVDQMASGTSGDDGIAIQVESCGTGCADSGSSSNIAVAGNVVRGGATAGDFDFAISGGYTISAVTLSDNEFWGGPDGVRDANFGGGGSLSNVTMTDNFSHNNKATPQQGGLPQRGYTLPYNTGITQSGITVNGWRWCADAGGAPVPSSGTSNGVTATDVATYTGCTTAPSTTTPPPVYPGSGTVTPVLVKSTGSARLTSGGTSFTLSGLGAAAGHLLELTTEAYAAGNTPLAVSSITDSAGDSWHYSTATSSQSPPADGAYYSTGNYYGFAAAAYAPNAGAASSVTVTFSAPVTVAAYITVYEWSGLPATASADGSAASAGIGTGTSFSAPAITTTRPDAVVAQSAEDYGWSLVSSPYQFASSGAGAVDTAWAAVTSPGTQNVIWSGTSQVHEAAAVLAVG